MTRDTLAGWLAQHGSREQNLSRGTRAGFQAAALVSRASSTAASTDSSVARSKPASELHTGPWRSHHELQNVQEGCLTLCGSCKGCSCKQAPVILSKPDRRLQGHHMSLLTHCRSCDLNLRAPPTSMGSAAGSASSCTGETPSAGIQRAVGVLDYAQ